MGKIREFTCPSCQESWQVNVGHGIGHATLEGVLGAFPPDIQEKIKETTAGGHLPLFEFNYHAALCPQCRRIISIPVIKLLTTAQSFSPLCPDCGNHIIILSDSPDIPCPRCNETQLSVRNAGRWD